MLRLLACMVLLLPRSLAFRQLLAGDATALKSRRCLLPQRSVRVWSHGGWGKQQGGGGDQPHYPFSQQQHHYYVPDPRRAPGDMWVT